MTVDDLVLHATMHDELSAKIDKVDYKISALGNHILGLAGASATAAAATGSLGGSIGLLGGKVNMLGNHVFNAGAALTRLGRPFQGLGLNIAGLGVGLNNLGGRIMNFATSGSTMARTLSAIGSGVSAVGGELAHLGLQGLHSMIRLVERAAFAVGALTVATGLYGFKLATQNEQFKVGVASMLGSDEAATKLYKDLQAFARVTPFNLAGLKPLAQTLLGTGVAAEDLIPTMRGLGDVVAAVGGDDTILKRVVWNLGQVQAAGKLTAREMRDFATAGIPAVAQLSEALGITKEQFTKILATKGGGVKLFDQLGGGKGIAEALGGGKFKGLMDKQSKTIGGMMSNIKDAFQQGLSDGIEAAFPILGPKLKKLQDRMGPIMENFGLNFGAMWGALDKGDRFGAAGFLAKALHLPPESVSTIAGIMNQINGIITKLKANGPALMKFFGNVTAGLLGIFNNVLIPVAGYVIGLFNTIADVMKAALGAFDRITFHKFAPTQHAMPTAAGSVSASTPLTNAMAGMGLGSGSSPVAASAAPSAAPLPSMGGGTSNTYVLPPGLIQVAPGGEAHQAQRGMERYFAQLVQAETERGTRP